MRGRGQRTDTALKPDDTWQNTNMTNMSNYILSLTRSKCNLCTHKFGPCLSVLCCIKIFKCVATHKGEFPNLLKLNILDLKRENKTELLKCGAKCKYKCNRLIYQVVDVLKKKKKKNPQKFSQKCRPFSKILTFSKFPFYIKIHDIKSSSVFSQKFGFFSKNFILFPKFSVFSQRFWLFSKNFIVSSKLMTYISPVFVSQK